MSESPEQNRRPRPARRTTPTNTSRSPSYSYLAQANNERHRIPSENQYESQDYQRFIGDERRRVDDMGSIRSTTSRFSLNEHFAASRRDFEFDMESDTESILEPAPMVYDDYNEGNMSDEQDVEDAMSDISEAEILRLMDADDDEQDYYTLLALPRDPAPTTAQIRAAYHRRSLAFHPDKQPPALKAAAERHFSRLQRAYETLVEPRKRVIYDLEGEEGVQEEYKMGGAMGQGGEGEMLDVGIKTLNPAEFKAWFMSILKKRERRAVEALVGSTGDIKVFLDGRRLFMEQGYIKLVDEETGQVAYTPMPRIQVGTLSVEHDFLVPLSGADQLYHRCLRAIKDLMGHDFDEVEDMEARNWETAAYNDSPTLSVSAGVTGKIVTKRGAHFIEQEDGTTEPFVVPQPIFISEQFTIGAGIQHKFQDADTTDSKTSSLLAGSQISCSTTFLPRQTYTLGITRAFTLLENTRPFFVNVEATQEHNQNPPEFNATITRQVTNNSSIFARLHSGSYFWPEWMQINVINKIFNTSPYTLLGDTPSGIQLGWIYSAGGMLRQPDSEPAPSLSNENWKIAVGAWSTTVNLTATYGRDLFVRSLNPPVRSRIMNSGEALPNQKPKYKSSSTGIRLEVDTKVDIDMSLSWSIRGLKRVGEFTSLGLDIGVTSGNLLVAFAWKRLGQSVAIPVMILPSELLNSRAVLFTLAFPWGLYSAYEFLLLRPAEKQARRRIIRQKRKELRASVARKREEALQAIELMAPMVAYKQALESENNGLVILEARYGSPSPGVQKGMGEFVPGEVVEVSIPLASLVESGQLVLSKKVDRNGITGFYDPVPLGRKGLGVRYLFGGRLHMAYVGEKEALVLPKREHEVIG